MTRAVIRAGVTVALGLVAAAAPARADDGKLTRNFAGSIQLDYLAVPTDDRPRDVLFDGATVEVSLKLAVDFGDHVSANVKVCVACHGLETGMAYFDLRAADAFNVRVGRFTPAFGAFPLRHDPANHRTSDKPLPYDMGRMVRFRDFDEGILPAPWVDNGIELDGTVFAGEHVQFDYAAYAVGGPKGDADPVEFNYKLSRTPERYYIDNNSEPTVGARVATTLDVGGDTTIGLGASAMAGHYDPDARLGFTIVGGDLTVHHAGLFVRAEYLMRRMEMALGDMPATRFKYGPGADGNYDDFVVRDGFYAEVEVPIRSVALVARWDGLRQRGNVLATSGLRSDTIVLRYTAAAAFRLPAGLWLKTSAEVYDFSDFSDELAIHAGVVGAF